MSTITFLNICKRGLSSIMHQERHEYWESWKGRNIPFPENIDTQEIIRKNVYTTFNRINILHSIMIRYKSNRKIFVNTINKGTKYLKMLLYIID
jgi:hypothetical protein